MKKITLLFFLIVASAKAQPILNASDIIYTSGTGFNANFTGFSPGAAGANQTWDFSTLNLTPVITNITLPSDQTPYFTSFPNAQFCYKGTTTLNTTVYEYFSSDETSYEYQGTAFNETAMSNLSADPMKVFQFPYTYGTSFNDQYRIGTSSPLSFTNTYDAYGTVILPFGTFTNVIRQKRLFINGLIQYYWYTVNPYFEIMYYSTDQTNIRVFKNASLSTTPNAVNDKISIYPNPNNGTFAVSANIQLKKITLTDMFGKEIWSSIPNALSQNIVLDHPESGVYFLKVVGENHEALIKKIIVK